MLTWQSGVMSAKKWILFDVGGVLEAVGTEPAFWAAVGAALELDDEQCAAMRADSGMRTAAPETSS